MPVLNRNWSCISKHVNPLYMPPGWKITVNLPMCFPLHHWANPAWVKMPRRMSSPPRPALKQAAGHDRPITVNKNVWKSEEKITKQLWITVRCKWKSAKQWSKSWVLCKLFSNLPRINPIQLRVTSYQCLLLRQSIWLVYQYELRS